jgi:hypothetical protein
MRLGSENTHPFSFTHDLGIRRVLRDKGVWGVDGCDGEEGYR